MGTWGAGNFEADDPREFLANLVARWERIIDQALAGEPTEEVAGFHFEPGCETLDGAIMPTVEILVAVAERLPCDHLPGPSRVAQWSAQALRTYDSDIDRWGTDGEYKAERRAVIEATFARLAEIVAEREDEAESA